MCVFACGDDGGSGSQGAKGGCQRVGFVHHATTQFPLRMQKHTRGERGGGGARGMFAFLLSKLWTCRIFNIEIYKKRNMVP